MACGLILEMNNGQNTNPDINFINSFGGSFQDRRPRSVNGTPESDVIVFTGLGFPDRLVQVFWEPYFAYEVIQRRIPAREGANGPIPEMLVLEVGRGGEMTRAVWDVIDRRTGTMYQESATGVFTMTADRSAYSESWQLIFYRGDYLLKDGELIAAGGGSSGGGEPT